MGPVVYIKTYIFDHFYKQYLVLLTMAPRNTAMSVLDAEHVVVVDGVTLSPTYRRPREL